MPERPPSHVFQARIFYAEPTFALHRNIPARVYSGGTYYVHAPDEFKAEDLAIAEFRRKAAQSSVSWVREIVRCEVCRCTSNAVAS
ncbi:MAG TPA: hypothetical protein VM389_02825 [Phycisphaerae bacterium]|nr:hypothetical protein [Phycisphaerae bacterium]